MEHVGHKSILPGEIVILGDDSAEHDPTGEPRFEQAMALFKVRVAEAIEEAVREEISRIGPLEAITVAVRGEVVYRGHPREEKHGH